MHRILGIIAEYNPLHSGHFHHLKTAIDETKADYTIIALSGNFVQRGEPAIFDKWVRAEMALRAGADLVIEIPTYFVLQSAEGFARSGVSLLANCGITDLSFGSESGDVRSLQRLADWLESPKAQSSIVTSLKSGISYAAAIQRSAENQGGEIAKLAGILARANNILAIEYLRAIKRTSEMVNIHTVKRIGPQHGSLVTGEFASATAIRKLLHGGRIEQAREFIPPQLAQFFTATLKDCVFTEDFSHAILYSLCVTATDILRTLPACSEGLENRLKTAVLHAENAFDLVQEVKTKRYPLTRIQRLLMQTMLQFQTVTTMHNYAPYLRILGCSPSGKRLLSGIVKLNKSPLVYSARDVHRLSPSAKTLLDLDIRAAQIYNLARSPKARYEDLDKTPVN